MAAVDVQRGLGPGLMESAYEECLTYELINAGMQVERQRTLPLEYKELRLPAAYKVDMIVDQKVVVEIKSSERLANVYTAQILTYLKLTGLEVGLIINFFATPLGRGIKRVVRSEHKFRRGIYP